MVNINNFLLLMTLPIEIIEKILLLSTIELCIVFKIPICIIEKNLDDLFLKSLHTWYWAAKRGYLFLIKYLHRKQINHYSNHIMTTAAANGHLDVVKFLYYNRNE